MPHTLRIIGGGMMAGSFMYHGSIGAAIGVTLLTVSFIIANGEQS